MNCKYSESRSTPSPQNKNKNKNLKPQLSHTGLLCFSWDLLPPKTMLNLLEPETQIVWIPAMQRYFTSKVDPDLLHTM